MRDTWKSILGENEELEPLTDTATVYQVETLVPKFSSDDRLKIETLMDEGKIFSQVTHHDDRTTLLIRLSGIAERILSFHTLSYDGRYVLQSCSQLLRELLPPFKRGSRCTIRKEFFRARQAMSDTREATDTISKDASQGAKDVAVARAYCQLHLFVMLHGAAPKKAKGKRSMHCLHRWWWNKLAHLATYLGFNTPQIQFS